MAFNYDPNNAQTTWPDGDYTGEIILAEEKTSKSGNEMLELKIKLKNGSGQQLTVTDYIVSTVNFHLSRLKRLCAACEPPIKWEKGQLDPEKLVGQVVDVVVRTDEGDGDFGDKNVARGYKPATGGKKLAGTTVTNTQGDEVKPEDIPF